MKKEERKIKVKVLASVTYSRSFEVIVNENYTDADLRNAVKQRKSLPNDTLEKYYEKIEEYIKSNDWLSDGTPLNELLSEQAKLKPWHEDEFEVVEE